MASKEGNQTKGLEYYLKLPWTLRFIPDPEGGFTAKVEELKGCISQGDDFQEAYEMIQEALQLWLESAIEHGDPIPEPGSEDDYSGKFVVRVPKSVHRDLAIRAQREGVSLNNYIVSALSRSVGQ
jgi:antitoxin HicB